MKSLRGKMRSIIWLGSLPFSSQQATGNSTQERLKSLREPSESRDDSFSDVAVEEKTEEEEASSGDNILCRQCHQVITSEMERVAIQGSHQHTFANPNGNVFEIGCFGHTIGCAYAGPPSIEFTWFAGFSWRVAMCGMCLTHLGWHFESAGGKNFHGLIADRLVNES